MLHLHRAERADALVAMLGELLAEPLADVLAPEVVSVPTRGIERWLAQQLSCRLGTTPGRRDGACGNVDMPFPAALVNRVVGAASGLDPDQDPWAPDRSVWYLLDILGSRSGEPWLEALAAHLERTGPPGEARRFSAARHVADLFDRYGVHRPAMLLEWAAGATDLRPEDRWQADLWRALREEIGVPSPPERTAGACEALRGGAGAGALPERASVFGVTRLPASYLVVLGALAATRDVHLFLLHPSPVLWDRITCGGPRARGGLEASGSGGELPWRGLPRAKDTTGALAENPLLRSWGEDAREMQLVIASSLGAHEDHHRDLPAPEKRASAPSSLLQRIQADVRANRRLPGPPPPGAPDQRMLLAPEDDSVRVHACHGRARQVEVVRDAVLHLLAEHPDLEPRDVVVMCPDIETYAPLIHATFGSRGEAPDGDAAPGGTGAPAEPGAPTSELRVRLADRSLRQTNPLLAVVAQLLELAATRVTASQVLDFVGKDPVRRRFGLDHEDVARLEEWVASAGIRWGLDARHRAPFKLDRLDANSWRAGLDRVLLGVTMADERQRSVGGVVPLDDVDSGEIDLAGRFAEVVDRLGAAVTAFCTLRAVDEWAETIMSAVADLTRIPEHEAWQAGQLKRLLDGVVEHATVNGAVCGARLSLADMSALLADRLRGQPARANFRTGHLTVCTLVPMRSVPHRVICLVGLDDGAFPRHTERDGDDLVLREPHVGDRDPRTEDRQLLLDALLAATEHLVVTYSGRDERTNLPRPPAVPLGELLDAVDRTAVCVDGRPAREQVVVQHPLQPFDPRCFATGALVPGRPWGFDQANLGGARALRGERRHREPFASGSFPEFDASSVELPDLERFVKHPVRAFLRQRLGIWLGSDEHDPADSLPVELNGLETWSIGDRVLDACLRGSSLDGCLDAERERGQLPPGALADDILSRMRADVDALLSAAVGTESPESLDVHLRLPDGTEVVGTVAGVRGDVLHRVTYSRLGPRERLVAWVRLLALTVARPEQPFRALTIGRTPNQESDRSPRSQTSPPSHVSPRSHVTVSRVGPLGDTADERFEVAAEGLAVLVDLFRRAMREPLPLFCKTSAAWAEARRREDENAFERVGKEWGGFGNSSEDADAEHRLVFGASCTLDDLLAIAPRADEAGPGWASSESTRVGRLARRLWDGLLDWEQVTTK